MRVWNVRGDPSSTSLEGVRSVKAWDQVSQWSERLKWINGFTNWNSIAQMRKENRRTHCMYYHLPELNYPTLLSPTTVLSDWNSTVSPAPYLICMIAGEYNSCGCWIFVMWYQSCDKRLSKGELSPVVLVIDMGCDKEIQSKDGWKHMVSCFLGVLSLKMVMWRPEGMEGAGRMAI